MEGIWAVARARLRRRWAGLVALGLLAGIAGGMATAAVAGERRTVTVAPRLIAATKVHDVLVTMNNLDDDPKRVEAQVRAMRRAIAADPSVGGVWQLASYIGRTSESKDWYYPYAGLERDPSFYRPILAAGRLANPVATDEVVITAQTAAHTHLRVGSTIVMDFYSPDQIGEVGLGTEARPAGAQDVALRVVGLLRDPFDIAPGATNRFMLATPAFARRWARIIAGQPGFAVKLEHGTADIAPFVRRITRRLGPTEIQVHSNLDALRSNRSAERVARTTLLLLGGVIAVFGAFAVAQATRRHLSLDQGESVTLEALGFVRRDRVVAAAIPGVLAALVAGGVVTGLAYLLSPIFPMGRPRRLEPTPGFDLNVSILAVGALATAVVVMAAFVLAAAIGRPTRRTPTRLPARTLPTVVASAPPSVLFGTRLALEPSKGIVGTRSAVVGAAVGTAGALAALTFAASLHLLVSSPARYGADYDLSLESPAEQVASRSRDIASDRRVAAVAVQGSGTIEVEGAATHAVSLDQVRGRVRPILRSGRAPVGRDEIALGPALARRLHADVGDRVRVSGRPMVVVGTVLDSSSTTPDYAEGALLSDARLRSLTEGGAPGLYYQVVLVRLAPGVDRAATTADLDRRYPYGLMDESAPAVPPALRNIQDVQAVPLMLAGFFGALVVVALGNGLVVAGRRQRRQLGVVRSLGFTASQVRATMVSMGVTLAALALAFGVPIGLGAGIWVWTLLASQLDVAPSVSVPVLTGFGMLVGVVAVAALTAAWPAHVATDESAASVLRAE